MTAVGTGNVLHVLIQPFCLRFSLHEDEIVYLVAGAAEMQLDRMELLLGIDPKTQSLFDSNLGFLPVATTVLIRSEKTIVVDPGNHHIGFYGILALALRRFGLTPADVDLVVCTHSHHDHMGSLFVFRGKPLVLGAGEADYARMVYGAEETDARLRAMGPITEVPLHEEVELAPGVRAVSTPGHTPGHISVLVEAGAERIVVAGDTVMTRREYLDRRFSHWYTADQLVQLQANADRLQAWRPTRLLPGHDRELRLGPGGVAA
ncbi:MAG: MBL fold metallo-hydrolase [Armatimonadota bacterium]|nr:MBL fold metallo-hydrolase [Armatimonadota bacterium]MDR7489232.1 MBL fold metallo-hydrolase [Armatimonadota bacterium]MDR7492083.1 MBL fold metallo-hydrolase [Armatimonadota bacterium]MDR7528838.1 MBL fold metallo-hydrolase [Armatimonadota bacterium]MDR7586299.1 MBL fold metallo-hydrolase [Armatimonadota bacterium]